MRSVTSHVVFFFILLIGSASRLLAQHTDHEVAIAFAGAPQFPLASDNTVTHGFYQSPFLARIQYLATTNGVQGLYLFLERAAETRSRTDLWTDELQQPSTFNANLDERLVLTTLGLEVVRTLYSESGFRIAAGLGVGGVLGNADVTVHQLSNGRTFNVESCQLWEGIMASIFARARYTVYQHGTSDIGLFAMLRYWGYPTVGPLGQCGDLYNGPPLRSLQEVGYLAGISFGF